MFWDTFPIRDGFKLKDGRFRLYTKKRSITMRVVRYWNRLPGDVVDTVLGDFQGEAGPGPGQPDLAEVSLFTAGELD